MNCSAAGRRVRPGRRRRQEKQARPDGVQAGGARVPFVRPVLPQATPVPEPDRASAADEAALRDGTPRPAPRAGGGLRTGTETKGRRMKGRRVRIPAVVPPPRWSRGGFVFISAGEGTRRRGAGDRRRAEHGWRPSPPPPVRRPHAMAVAHINARREIIGAAPNERASATVWVNSRNAISATAPRL